MNLFNSQPIYSNNILPFDGTVNYFGPLMSMVKANKYFDILMESIEWKNDEARLFGKHFITKRKAAWYGDENYSYTYSNSTKIALPWTKELLELKKIAEAETGILFNSCLLNLYHSGEEGMAWHSDDESALDRKSGIASFSFGAERNFSFKHKTTKQLVSIYLENGSLLLMKDETQTNWLHRLAPTKKVSKPRINLTFRKMKGN